MDMDVDTPDFAQCTAAAVSVDLSLTGTGNGQDTTAQKGVDGTDGFSRTEHTAEVESTPDIVFYPPVGIQRYIKVSEVLQELLNEDKNPESLKSILEVGCAQLRLHTYLKKLHGSVQKLVYMDIDERLLERVIRIRE